MVARIKTSWDIKLWHTVGLQTPTMLMNTPCSLIMGCGEGSFFLAVFQMKYCLRWGTGLRSIGVLLQRILKGWSEGRVQSLVHVIHTCISKVSVCVCTGCLCSPLWITTCWRTNSDLAEDSKSVGLWFVSLNSPATPGTLFVLNVTSLPVQMEF